MREEIYSTVKPIMDKILSCFQLDEAKGIKGVVSRRH